MANKDRSALIEMPVGRMSAPRFFPNLKMSPVRDAITRSLPACRLCGAMRGDPCRTPQWKTTKPHMVREKEKEAQGRKG